MELGTMLERIHQFRGRIIRTEIAFDLHTIIERLLNFRPNFVLIDDNIGLSELRLAIDTIAENKHTRNTPITVIKNSNYVDAMPGSRTVDFILKPQLTAEALYHGITNSLKLSRTRKFLYRLYKKRKVQIIRLFR